jgi:hypothetical protein
VLLTEENHELRKIIGLEIHSRTLPAIQYSGPLTPEQQLQLEEALLELQGKESPQVDIIINKAAGTYSVKGADRDWVLTTNVDLSERLASFVGSERSLENTLRRQLGASGGRNPHLREAMSRGHASTWADANALSASQDRPQHPAHDLPGECAADAARGALGEGLDGRLAALCWTAPCGAFARTGCGG